MKQKKAVISILALVLMMATPSVFVLSVRPVHAGGGIVLHPPFDGTYRVTAYFDHDKPNYGYGADGYNWIYNGERVPASYPNKTGEPYPYDGHDGWDWSMGTGTNILAAAAGTVVVVEWGNWKGYGRTIVISHGNNYYTQYSHLDQLLVGVGASVTAGQHIAESGATPPGTPAHLHFGVRHGGYLYTTYATDPFGWRGSGRDPLFDYNGKESSCLWAGVPGDDISCADIIVEDDGAGWIEYYTWFDSTNGNGYREHHTYSWDPPPVSEAYWMPPLPAKGFYQVYAFVPPISSRTTHAHYVIDNGTTQYEVYRDQSGTAPRWMSLGTFEFPAGSYGWVNLDDYTTEPKYSHWVAADSMKFSASVVYLPDVKNWDNWTSSIIIRNNSTSSAQVGISYYNSSGSRVSYQTTTIAANGSETKTPPSDFSGSAVVVASKDVSVVGENFYSYGVRYLAAAHPGEMAPATTVYAPYVVQKWFSGHSSWRQTTDLVIQNTSILQTATVTVTFYDSWGGYSGSHQETRTIPANGQIAVSGTEMPDYWESWWGVSMASAVISSTQPVAIVARTYTGVANSSGVIVTPYLVGSYRAFTSGADEVYLPVAAREYYNYDSSLQVQNARNGNTTFRVKYYYQDGSQAGPTFYRTAGPYRSVNLWRPSGLPSGFIGSAVVEVTSGGPVAAMAQYDTFDTSQNRYGVNQYEGVTAGTRSEVLPHVQGTSPWDWTGIVAQNMGGSTTNITITFYNQSGSWADSETEEDVNSKAAALYWDTSMPDISGSAVASSSPAMPVALAVNFDRSESWTNKDRMMGYGAVK